MEWARPGLPGRRISRNYSIYFVLVALIVLSSVINPNFFSGENISNVTRQISVTTILAFGETILIICGLLDLSSGSVLALSGLLSVASYKSTGSMELAFLVAIAVAMGCNLVSAIMVTRFAAPSFIATLAMQEMARGGALLFTKGQNIYQIGDYTVVGQGSVGFIPIPVLFLIALFFLTWYILKQTRSAAPCTPSGATRRPRRPPGST